MAGSNNDPIRIAIEFFRASRESSTAQGQPILAKLDAAFKSGKIIFTSLDPNLTGQARGDTIEMNQLERDPAKISVWLVHEGFHRAAKPNELEIDEEIQSRQLQGRYVQSLMQGISFEGKTYRVAQGGQVLDAYLTDRVVDWVLSMKEYTNKQGFLTQRWIGKHIQDWKGPANRTIFTNRMYFAILAKRPDRLEDIPPVARALIAILKVSTVPEAKTLITLAGGGNFARGQALVKERIQAMSGGSAQITEFANSVLAWQKETGIDIGMVPRR